MNQPRLDSPPSASTPHAQTSPIFRPSSTLSHLDRRYVRSDDAALGQLRAFDRFYHRRKKELEDNFTQRSLESERLHQWRSSHIQSQLFAKRKSRDRGVLERVASDLEKVEFPTERCAGSRIVAHPPLPKEDRAVWGNPNERVFYWGA
jgi:hypothetical protein